MKKTRRKKQETLGQALTAAIKEALAHPERIKTVRPNVASLRKQLKLTQREFAESYNIRLQTLRQWEQGLRTPDSATMAYLTCIARKPDMIRNILRD